MAAKRKSTVTTLAIGEETAPVTTLAVGEENPPVTTLAIGEEHPPVTTLMWGEEGGFMGVLPMPGAEAPGGAAFRGAKKRKR